MSATADRLPPGHRHGTPMYRRISVSLFLAGLATFALLYCTQPLLPTLASTYRVSPAEAAWTVSAATIGLGLTLLVAGPLSDVVGRTRLMHASLFASVVVALLCGLVDSWPVLLVLRGLLGVTLAGLPAVALAYLSEEVDAGDVPRAAGSYIGGTALGGMSGRLLTGWLAELLGPRAALLGIGVLALVCASAVLVLLPRSRRFRPAPASAAHLLRATRTVLRDPGLLCLFGIAASSMGAFVGVFNALGFRLEEPPYGLSVGVAGLVFLTYALGSAGSNWAGRAAARYGHRSVEPVAVVAMLAGIVLTAASPLWLVILGVAVMTLGFFATHGVASGWVASRAKAGFGAAGQASSLYLFSYYAGSSLFGALAAQAWGAAAWPGVTALAAALVGTALALALTLRRIPAITAGHA